MICAIVLAAGRSQRMGAQKLLLPFSGKPVITRIVDELLLSPLQKIFVVIGRDGELVRQALSGREVAFVPNPDFEGDMLSSVRCGLRSLPGTCEAALVVLGDQPAITHELVGSLIHAFCEQGKGIVVPTHGGRRGHPMLFAARFREEVLTQYDGVGLHGLLDAHPNEVLEVAVPTASLLEDMDTPGDYERLKAQTDGVT